MMLYHIRSALLLLCIQSATASWFGLPGRPDVHHPPGLWNGNHTQWHARTLKDLADELQVDWACLISANSFKTILYNGETVNVPLRCCTGRCHGSFCGNQECCKQSSRSNTATTTSISSTATITIAQSTKSASTAVSTSISTDVGSAPTKATSQSINSASTAVSTSISTDARSAPSEATSQPTDPASTAVPTAISTDAGSAPSKATSQSIDSASIAVSTSISTDAGSAPSKAISQSTNIASTAVSTSITTDTGSAALIAASESSNQSTSVSIAQSLVTATNAQGQTLISESSLVLTLPTSLSSPTTVTSNGQIITFSPSISASSDEGSQSSAPTTTITDSAGQTVISSNGESFTLSTGLSTATIVTNSDGSILTFVPSTSVASNTGVVTSVNSAGQTVVSSGTEAFTLPTGLTAATTITNSDGSVLTFVPTASESFPASAVVTSINSAGQTVISSGTEAFTLPTGLTAATTITNSDGSVLTFVPPATESSLTTAVVTSVNSAGQTVISSGTEAFTLPTGLTTATTITNPDGSVLTFTPNLSSTAGPVTTTDSLGQTVVSSGTESFVIPTGLSTATTITNSDGAVLTFSPSQNLSSSSSPSTDSSGQTIITSGSEAFTIPTGLSTVADVTNADGSVLTFTPPATITSSASLPSSNPDVITTTDSAGQTIVSASGQVFTISPDICTTTLTGSAQTAVATFIAQSASCLPSRTSSSAVAPFLIPIFTQDPQPSGTSTPIPCDIWFFNLCIHWLDIDIWGWYISLPPGSIGPPPSITFPSTMHISATLKGSIVWPSITISNGKPTYSSKPTDCTTESATLCLTSTSFGVSASGDSTITTSSSETSYCGTVYGCKLTGTTSQITGTSLASDCASVTVTDCSSACSAVSTTGSLSTTCYSTTCTSRVGCSITASSIGTTSTVGCPSYPPYSDPAPTVLQLGDGSLGGIVLFPDPTFTTASSTVTFADEDPDTDTSTDTSTISSPVTSSAPAATTSTAPITTSSPPITSTSVPTRSVSDNLVQPSELGSICVSSITTIDCNAGPPCGARSTISCLSWIASTTSSLPQPTKSGSSCVSSITTIDCNAGPPCGGSTVSCLSWIASTTSSPATTPAKPTSTVTLSSTVGGLSTIPGSSCVSTVTSTFCAQGPAGISVCQSTSTCASYVATSSSIATTSSTAPPPIQTPDPGDGIAEVFYFKGADCLGEYKVYIATRIDAVGFEPDGCDQGYPVYSTDSKGGIQTLPWAPGSMRVIPTKNTCKDGGAGVLQSIRLWPDCKPEANSDISQANLYCSSTCDVEGWSHDVDGYDKCVNTPQYSAKQGKGIHDYKINTVFCKNGQIN